jgi:hypothetical protein
MRKSDTHGRGALTMAAAGVMATHATRQLADPAAHQVRYTLATDGADFDLHS